MPARTFQVTFDAADPRRLGEFWIAALGYAEEAPPEGFDGWPAALTAWGLPPERHNDAYAIVDPSGSGPRIFIQKVPEPKTAKNRVHLDIRVSGIRGNEGKTSALSAEAERLAALGGTRVEEIHNDLDHFVVMQDPEGNEFCLT